MKSSNNHNNLSNSIPSNNSQWIDQTTQVVSPWAAYSFHMRWDNLFPSLPISILPLYFVLLLADESTPLSRIMNIHSFVFTIIDYLIDISQPVLHFFRFKTLPKQAGFTPINVSLAAVLISKNVIQPANASNPRYLPYPSHYRTSVLWISHASYRAPCASVSDSRWDRSRCRLTVADPWCQKWACPDENAIVCHNTKKNQINNGSHSAPDCNLLRKHHNLKPLVAIRAIKWNYKVSEY